MENDLDVLGYTLDEFAYEVPGLSPEDALEVLWAVARLADAIESGKAGRNGQLVR